MAAIRPSVRSCSRAALIWFLAAFAGTAALAQDATDEQLARGAYVFHIADCASCHTAKDGMPLAGGRALATPFGTFYSPNITPDPQHGIGTWSLAQFDRALRRGVAPGGTTLYPAFPYDHFSHMTDSDVADLYAYLMAQPPSANVPPAHDLDFPFSLRSLLGVWRMLYFDPGPLPQTGDRHLDRGRYLVDALGHCGACHTPRTALGGANLDMYLAGTADGPDGKRVPNITPDPKTGIGGWSKADIVSVLKTGFLPDGDVVAGPMGEVVEQSTSHLTDDDADAIATYLLAIPPIVNKP